MVNVRLNTRAFKHGNVIVDMPSQLLNEAKIDHCISALVDLAEGLEKWVLLCIPDDSVRITPAAAAMLTEALQRVLNIRCRGIFMLTSTPNSKILEHAIHSCGLHEQFITSPSIEFLCTQAEKILHQEHVLDDTHAKGKARIFRENYE